MGDHRAQIKIEMEFHGVKDKCDMWINYSEGECDGVDDRVIAFFRRIYQEGMLKYEDTMAQLCEDQYKDEIERFERMELVRLQNKYGRSI